MIELLNPDEYDRLTANRAATNSIARALKEIYRSRSYPESMAETIRERMLDLMMVLISLRPCLGSEEYRDYLAMIEAIPSSLVYPHKS